MHILLVWTILLSIISNTGAARILGIVPSPSYSHQIVFRPLWKELSLRGHQVTTLTTDPINDPSLVNLTEINLHASYDVWNSILLEAIESTQQNLFKALMVMMESMDTVCQMQLKHPEVQNLIHNENGKFDLVIAEYFTPIMFAFAERFNCPLIGMLSLDAPSNILKLIGNPTHPILYPDYMLAFTDNLSFTERIKSVAFSLMVEIYINYYFYSVQQKHVDTFFGSKSWPLKEIAQNVSMLFVNSDPVFHKVKALLPNVIQIGGGSHRTPTEPLPQEIKEILDNAQDDVIYFSLGSNVKSKDIPTNVRNTILSAFSELPYTVLWKFEAEHLLNKPKNVIIAKWFPQQNLLKHPNIKLFITQGGLQSIEEAIYEHIPMVAIPFFGDQFYNAERMVNKGFGLSIDYTKLEKDTFKTTLLEVINNPKYKSRIKEMAELAADQPMTGLEKAVWWTEYVIRHKGAKHFRSPILDIPFYQYYLIDIIVVLSFFVVVLLFVFYHLLKIMYRIVKYLCYTKNISKVKIS